MFKNRDEALMMDMLESIEHVLAFTEGMTEAEYNKDIKTRAAVAYKLQIIGDASQRISDDLKMRYPEIPLDRSAGLRYGLLFGYTSIDDANIWHIIKNFIPTFADQLRKALQEVQASSPPQ
jgi:uncharacterized protein with HEPN domain